MQITQKPPVESRCPGIDKKITPIRSFICVQEKRTDCRGFWEGVATLASTTGSYLLSPAIALCNNGLSHCFKEWCPWRWSSWMFFCDLCYQQFCFSFLGCVLNCILKSSHLYLYSALYRLFQKSFIVIQIKFSSSQLSE